MTWALPFTLGLALIDRLVSPGQLGLLLAARTVGFLLVLPAAGVAADRTSPRVVIMISGVTVVAATLVLAGALGRSTVLAAIAVGLVGMGEGACRPSFQALIADVVEPPARQTANAILTLSARLAVLAGPVVTVAATQVMSVRQLITTYAVIWLVTSVLPPRRSRVPTIGGAVAAPTKTGSWLADFTAGVREARRHRWFAGGLGALGAVIFTGYSVTAVALPIASQTRDGTGQLLAVGLTCYSAGALVGAVAMSRWRPRAQGWTALTGLVLYAATPTVLALHAPVVAVGAAYAVAGVGVDLFNVPWFTATQREVAPNMMSRVSAMDFLVSYGLAPIGLAVMAPAISHLGFRPVMWACAAVCLLAPALAMLVPGSRGFAEPPTGAGAGRVASRA